MMRHYMTVKEQHKDCILLYRLGDFYEMFFDDALLASKVLDITLTSRDCGLPERAPMCGVPFHSVNGYIQRLIEGGYHVAICEQLSDPSQSKGLVEREVVRIITPGTVIENDMLEDRRNNFLLSLYLAENRVGLAYVDVSTGDLSCALCEKSRRAVEEEISRIRPSEIIFCASDAPYFAAEIALPVPPVVRPDEDFDRKKALSAIRRRLTAGEIKPAALSASAEAAGGLFAYLDLTQKNALSHINSLKVYTREEHLQLDPAARRNLELTENLQTRRKRGSLLGLMDRTVTSMGGRELRHWIEEPLGEIAGIQRRQDGVEELFRDYILLQAIREELSPILDIERLIGKIAYQAVNARDLLALKASIAQLPRLKTLLQNANCEILRGRMEQIDGMRDLHDLLERSIATEPPLTIREGGIIRDGYDAELDETRAQAGGGKDWLLKLEEAERQSTGIKSLKIGYNRVFGYFIEVTKANSATVPYRYVRKQTLANAERYTTEELQKYEENILSAQDRSVKREYALFCEIRDRLAAQIPRFQQSADAVKTIDVLQSLALLAAENGYARPEMHPGFALEIIAGRHPVVEGLSKEPFVPNDTLMDDEGRLLIITGPNMAGKSTYMRQVALIALMAHMGSFVPAQGAKIPLLDRIFTRVGASDDLSTGQSTFMVEMNEMAQILAGATRRSLLVLDEIGRGTSTFDGLSIAWAAVEHIASQSQLGAKTLFATHYHELSELEGRLPGVINYSIAVREHGEEVIFLRKIQRGGADHSFGVQVASMAGLPQSLVARAREIMAKLEVNDMAQQISQNILSGKKKPESQVGLLEYSALSFAKELAEIDVNAMTPVQALNVLYTLREKARAL
jgi:DNA mismatch repair protein MutS